MALRSISFTVKCAGRNLLRKELLNVPVDVEVEVSAREGSNVISSSVKCPYNGGAHGDTCNLASQNGDVHCAYVCDFPHFMDIAKSK